MVNWRNPAISNQETLEWPWVFGGVDLISLEDGAGNVRNVLSGIRFAGNIQLSRVSKKALCDHISSTHIIVLVFGEKGEELVEKGNHVLGHLVEFGEVAVRVHVAEASAYGLVYEEQVGELVPGAIVVLELASFADSVGADFHHSAVHGGAARAAVQP